MSLPDHFQFTQSSLQDYVDCPRRFQLRYILNQAWPAVPSEPLLEHERHAELGGRFHRMVEQHIAGLPIEQLTASIADPDLARWWRSYLNTPPPDASGPLLRRAEVVLSAALPAHLAGADVAYRLAARYDLLAVEPGRRAIIVDWKTERRRPRRETLAARLQTRVYRYVLVEAGQSFNGGQRLEPEQVTMVYWLAEFPAEPEIFSYNDAQYADDAAYLSSLATDILTRTEAVFPLTPRQDLCRFCVYRSLCNRGLAAGLSEAEEPMAEDDLPLDFDLAGIAEIAY